jgi:hypothetical protein
VNLQGSGTSKANRKTDNIGAFVGKYLVLAIMKNNMLSGEAKN